MSGVFEGSVSGALDPAAVVECGVCWWTYDPAVGDDEAQIPPGVAFADLPDTWRCPQCDADKGKFMVPEGGAVAARATTDASLAARVDALAAAYRAAEPEMIGLPVHNAALGVEMVGFRTVDAAHVGVVVTPWCMNLVRLPADPAAPPPGALGSARSIGFPSGAYTFTLARMEGVGLFEACSLFSPMEMFDDMDVARATAQAAADGLFEAPEPAPAPAVTRRFMFTVNGAAT